MTTPTVKRDSIVKTRFERLSRVATISRHTTAMGIDLDAIHTKSLEAKANPRKREILVLHRDDSDPLHRMLNAIEPQTYVRPHRHHTPPKAEVFVLLSGSMGFVPFLNDGTPDEENFIWLHPTKGSLIADCREDVWHTLLALETNTVVFEAKAGPFDPATDKEFAPWAPPDDSPDAQDYLRSLEQAFRNKFGL